jgi:cytoskeletal protein RodZ
VKTVGQILKEARTKKKYSLEKIGEITKIKSSFIDLIEKEKWSALPPFPTVLGFVKSLASPLGLSETASVAFLKRDYPPKVLRINPKPDVSPRFTWSPRLTFLAGIGIFATVVFGYLIFQYVRFTSPPKLTLDSPKENQSITGTNVLVFGSTEVDAKILVNNQPVLTDDDGKFTVSIEITKETKEIIVKAISRSGKTSQISRKIMSAGNR